jgi:hypothetical protein
MRKEALSIQVGQSDQTQLILDIASRWAERNRRRSAQISTKQLDGLNSKPNPFPFSDTPGLIPPLFPLHHILLTPENGSAVSKNSGKLNYPKQLLLF